MKEILLTEKVMVFLVLLYFHGGFFMVVEGIFSLVVPWLLTYHLKNIKSDQTQKRKFDYILLRVSKLI